MPDIKQREEKIKEKRRHTPWGLFVKNLMSRYPVVFYKNNNLISKYPANDRIRGVIDKQKFEETRDGLLSTGIDYDFSIPFFENVQKLFRKVEFPNLFHVGSNENGDFADTLRNCKNVYLSRNITNSCENVLYSFSVKENSRNITNSFMVRKDCDNIFSSMGVVKSFNIFYSKYIYNSSDIWFSSNLIGCHECLLCDNLDNQSFCIHNVKYEKEEYLSKKKEILRSKEMFTKYFTDVLEVNSVNIHSEQVQGQFFVDSQNVENGYYIYNLHGGRNVVLTGYSSGMEEVYDTFISGAKGNYYGCVNSGGYSENIFNSVFCTMGSMNIHHSCILDTCSYCLGCVGLKNKSFCILNKEYPKEERFALVNKIFAQMEEEGTLGDFFPGWMSPTYFNDTVAYLMDDSITKEEAVKAGFLRRDGEIKTDIPPGSDAIKVKDVKSYQGYDNQGNWTINPEILKKVIIDEKGNYYRIVKMEYDFLVKHGLPLPELHWLERIKLGFKFK